jgi:peptidoglycan/LPS O-acetylase OafA/YrhL
MLLCELYRRWLGEHRLAAPLLALSAAFGVAFVLFGAPVAALTWAALVLGLALAKGGGLLSKAPLVWLGRISYATYLSHYLLLIVFKYLFLKEGEAVPPVLLAAYLVAVLAASALLYHGFERPAQRLVLRVWDRRRSGALSLAPAE